MQRRLCDCGCAIWVQFSFPNMNCRVVFKSKEKSTDNLTLCPCCGKRLSIDDLYLV